MFRKSDYLPPQLHPTYKQKPMSEFQIRSQLAEFDDGGRRRETIEKEEKLFGDPSTESVPATYDTVYAPQNPNADWGVSKHIYKDMECVIVS